MHQHDSIRTIPLYLLNFEIRRSVLNRRSSVRSRSDKYFILKLQMYYIFSFFYSFAILFGCVVVCTSDLFYCLPKIFIRFSCFLFLFLFFIHQSATTNAKHKRGNVVRVLCTLYMLSNAVSDEQRAPQKE